MNEVAAVGAASGAGTLAWLLFALPALGSLVLFLLGRRADRWGHWLGVLTVVAAFGVGLVLFLQAVGQDAAHRTTELKIFEWIAVGDLHVDFGLRLDPLSLTFVLLITG